MARIRTYVSDQNITASDKWIGTDGNDNNNTKNFYPNNLADFFNINESISNSSIRFTYDTIDSGSSRKSGTLSFKTEKGATVLFSSITTFMLSRSSQGSGYVDHFLQLLNHGTIVLHKSDNVDIHGLFKVNSIVSDISETDFYNVSLTYISGYGSLEEDKDYLITLIDLASISRTSQLINDGEDGVNPFITLLDLTDQIQSDWLQLNTSSLDYIKNKPNIPTNTSDLTNDGADETHPFITLEDLPSLSGYELIANKQNSLVTDGTGTKYPTVDAVNTALGNIPVVTNTSDLINDGSDGTNPFITLLDIPVLTGFVPYVGATQDLNLGEFGVQLGNIEFDLTPTNIPTGVGSMSWNDVDGTLDLRLKGGNVNLQIGLETVTRVVNKTSTNITLLEGNYQAVRITGAQGQRPKVDLALANNDLNSATTFGLVTETILNNQEGFVNTSGEVKEINTTGSIQGETWIDGDVLYLSGTVAGQITNIKPVAPVHTIIIGFVVYAHAIHGKIFVKVNNGYELEELHNVSAIAPNNNEILAYDLPTTLWKPKTVIGVLGYTPENVANKSITVTLGTSDTLYPTQNAVKTYVDSIVVGGDFANVVYVNSTNPSTATIFDLNNPPVTNDNALKADTGNIYIGNDNSNWIYKTSPAGYYTYTSTARSSNFYLAGTSTDAGNNKTAAIQRAGTIKAPKFITLGGNLNQFVKGDGSLDSSSYLILPSLTNGSVLFYNGTTIAQDNANLFWDNTNNRLGIGTNTPSNTLHLSAYNTNNSQVRIGGLEFQSYSINNTWFGDNVYYDGTNFKRRLTGFAGMFYFAGNEGQFRFFESNTAGTTVPSTLCQLKINSNGTFAIGSDVSNQQGIYSNAKFIIFGATGNVGLNTILDSGYKLDINGTARSASMLLTSQTASTIASFDTNKNVVSLPLETYPSLVELAYVKGVTSNIQTQLDSKSPMSIIPIEIGASTSLSSIHNGLPLIITASCTVTIPNGLAAGFNASFITLAGVTLTIALGASVVLFNNTGLTMAEKLTFTLQARTTTNNYITAGNL